MCQFRYCVFSFICLLLLLCYSHLACGEDTILRNPIYYNIAPCPCDLLPDECDPGCCCDAKCTTFLNLFPCIEGHFGGNSTVDNWRSCASQSIELPDYHPFTCVLVEQYNAFLGYFYEVQSALTTLVLFVNKYELFRPNNTFQVYNQMLLVETLSETISNASNADYRVGRALLGQARTGFTSGDANTRIALPQKMLGGLCDSKAAIRFQTSFSSACDIRVTVDQCKVSINSLLDAQSYLVYCATTPCNYLQVRKNRTTTVASPLRVMYYSYSSGVNFDKSLSSGINVFTGISNNTLPANVNVNGTLCTNAVVQVNYIFYWLGLEVVEVEAHVYLASITLNNVITQKFSAQFVHKTSSATVTYKSGFIGYETGLPLIGAKVFNTTHMVQNANSTLTIIKPDSTGQCSSVSTEPIQFRITTMSSCVHKVALSEFNNCTSLSEKLQSFLEKDVLDRYIAIYGDADLGNRSEWLSLLRSNLSITPSHFYFNGSNSTVNGSTTYPGMCMNMATRIRIVILFSEQGKAQGASIFQVVGARYEFRVSNLTFSCSYCNVSNPAASSMGVQLSTTVNFYQVPSAWKSNLRVGLYPIKSICWWGICWEDLLYPINADFEDDSRAFTLAWFCFLLGILIFTMTISRPWW